MNAGPDPNSPITHYLIAALFVIVVVRQILSLSRFRSLFPAPATGSSPAPTSRQILIRSALGLLLCVAALVVVQAANAAGRLLINITDLSYAPGWLVHLLQPEAFYFHANHGWVVAGYALVALVVASFVGLVIVLEVIVPESYRPRVLYEGTLPTPVRLALLALIGIIIAALAATIMLGVGSYTAFDDKGMRLATVGAFAGRTVPYADMRLVDVECIPYVYMKTHVDGFGYIMKITLDDGETLDAVSIDNPQRISRDDPAAPQVLPGYARLMDALVAARVTVSTNACAASKISQLDQFKLQQHINYFGRPNPLY